MSSVDIVPFRDDHLEDAAALVAARYRAERDLDKSLHARYEEPDLAASGCTIPDIPTPL